MIVKTPAIGIPNSEWKKRAVKFARSNPNIVKLDVVDLCYDCDRHHELLKIFDDGRIDYENSSYYKYSIENSKKNKEVAFKKIKNFKILYNSIKQGVFECPEDRLPIITEDGCRLDGSHKLTILDHIGCRETDVNIFLYDRVFSKKERKKIIADNVIFRKEIYSL